MRATVNNSPNGRFMAKFHLGVSQNRNRFPKMENKGFNFRSPSKYPSNPISLICGRLLLPGTGSLPAPGWREGYQNRPWLKKKTSGTMFVGKWEPTTPTKPHHPPPPRIPSHPRDLSFLARVASAPPGEQILLTQSSSRNSPLKGSIGIRMHEKHPNTLLAL